MSGRAVQLSVRVGIDATVMSHVHRSWGRRNLWEGYKLSNNVIAHRYLMVSTIVLGSLEDRPVLESCRVVSAIGCLLVVRTRGAMLAFTHEQLLGFR